MKSSELREKFLEYFQNLGHTIVPSSSLVPNDPTLLFTNAGMNQFKDVFLGQDKRSYSRATSSQCCVRAGGKHNDLDEVGYTARHHTFFEMLGNFSFGDYGKREAISYAWRFLTEELKIPAAKLWVTVFEDDQETENIWLKDMKIDPQRFSRCGAKDNFWSMGDTGPCGPCTEIFYDHGADVQGGPPGSKDESGDRYTEIWNLVFMQYNRDASGKMTPLESLSVDTGMGLERLSAVMQGVHDNYDTDIFLALIKEVNSLLHIKDSKDRAIRVIADHIRSCSFLIADGVIPSNEGRGYVLRRIIRRAVRHGHKLGMKEVFFYKLLSVLIKEMGVAYPKLKESRQIIEKILKQEEEQFNLTLDNGLKILDDEIKALGNYKKIPGNVVFRLYDTYGFPPDLTADVAKEYGLTIDQAGFDQEMARQKDNSRQANKFAVDYGEDLVIPGETNFAGYAQDKSDSKIIAIIQNGNIIETLDNNELAQIVLSETPFYAESGGQVGDKGRIVCGDNVFVVEDTQKQGPIYFHYGHLKTGSLHANMDVVSQIDNARLATAANHSATHLLHAALREVLGSHVKQRGSLVTKDYLRFDFSHFEALTRDELYQVEQIVNRNIRANSPIITENMNLEEAKEAGAMALFGEKYGDKVRVVKMGEVSKELCGGTHAKATGDIGFCKILSEGGVAAGVRRIEALTGEAALNYIEKRDRQFVAILDEIKAHEGNAAEKVQQLLEKTKEQARTITSLNQKLAVFNMDLLLDDAGSVSGIKVIAVEIKDADMNLLRSSVDHLRSKLKKGVIVLAAVNDGRVSLVAAVNGIKLHAGELVKHVAAQVGGKGGGRPDMAQGGGTLVDALPVALGSVAAWVESNIKN
ncbi:MAG: alanine--tRNA ligase [Gammaproteobacteria bacterium]|nr:alanine--tRNA ligase [Gammaproteobacteria bacterium]